MQARYSRNIPALSEEQCALLATKRVAVIGCGGLGGHIIELLARIGVGHIVCVDGDVFDETNLNRQLLSQEALLGTSKSLAAAERIKCINSRISCEGYSCFLGQDNAVSLIHGCDLVFDALDNVGARRILEQACEDEKIPYVHGAISGWYAQAAVCLPGQKLTRMLYPEDVEIKDKSVLSFTPALCASVQTSLGIKVLLGLPVNAGTLYFYDLLNQELDHIPMV